MLAKQEPRSNMGRCGSSSKYRSTGSLGEVSDVIIPIPKAAELLGGVEPGRTQQDSGWSSWNGSFPTGDVWKAKKSEISRVGFHSDLLIPSVLFENSGFFPLNFIWLGLKPSSLPELRIVLIQKKIVFRSQFSQNTPVLVGGKLIMRSLY